MLVSDLRLQLSYLCKHGGVFPGVTEGVDVPGDSGATANPKSHIEEPQTHGHLVDNGAVVRSGLITHAPAAIHKLQTAWRKRRRRGGEEEEFNRLWSEICSV